MKRIHREILNQILVQENLTLDSIATSQNKSVDEIKRAIHQINEALINGYITVVEQRIIMNEKSYDECWELLFRNNNFERSLFEIKFRRKLLLILIIKEERSSLDSLSEHLYVSRNTIFNDIKEIKKSLPGNLKIDYSRKTGYQMVGNNYMVLNCLVDHILDLIKFSEYKQRIMEWFAITRDDLAYATTIVNKLENQFNIKLTDDNYGIAPLIINILLMILPNVSLSEPITKAEWGLNDKINDAKIKAIRAIFEPKNILNDFEIEYIILWFLSLNITHMKTKHIKQNNVELGINEFLDSIETKLTILFLNRSVLVKELCQHVLPAMYRQLLGVQLTNPLRTQFQEEHSFIYKIVKASIHTIEKYMPEELSEDELVYIAMIVVGRLYEESVNIEKILKAIVLCTTGTSISKFLLESLKQLFPQIDFIGTSSIRDYEENNFEVDLIFSTQPFISKIPIVVVSPTFEENQKNSLIAEVNEIIKENEEVYVKKILDSISPFIKKEDIPKVKDRVKKTISNIKNISLEDKNEYVDIPKENITVIQQEVTWDTMIPLIFSPLLKRGSVDDNYIKYVEKSFYKEYMNMRIGPNIFLPHTHPKHGAKTMDYQMVLFTNPVDTPHGEGIKLIVALAPGANNEHIPILLRLNELFLDDKILTHIQSLNSEEAITNYLKELR